MEIAVITFGAILLTPAITAVIAALWCMSVTIAYYFTDGGKHQWPISAIISLVFYAISAVGVYLVLLGIGVIK